MVVKLVTFDIILILRCNHMHAVQRYGLLLQFNVVCLSVGHSSEPCKDSCTDWDAVWIVDLGGPRNHVLGGALITQGNG